MTDLHLNSYGAYLHVKEDLFDVRVKDENGQVRNRQIAAHKVRSIYLHKGMALSTDAVRLALTHNIDIVFLENSGRPLGRVWHSKLGSTTKIRKRQLEASLGPEGLDWTKEWIGEKLANQVGFLKDLKKHRAEQAAFIDGKTGRIMALRESVAGLQGGTVGEVAERLRGLEGTAGRLYFEALSALLTKSYRFEGRSSRPAKDPFNAFLNYAYGILYSITERALILAGIDPFVGFLHRDDYNQKSMVYDFIEPYRIHAEQPVFRLFSGKKVNQRHTDAITNGCSLNAEGKQLLVEAFNKHFREQRIRYKGRNQTRDNAMQLDAHAFAQALLGKGPVEVDILEI